MEESFSFVLISLRFANKVSHIGTIMQVLELGQFEGSSNVQLTY